MDSLVVEDSDGSSLDIQELNDIEYDIPPSAPLSLESILWEIESEEGSDTTSLHSIHSFSQSQKFKSLLYHGILQGISSQLVSAKERVGAGSPTVIANSAKTVAVGTSHGYLLAFDSDQKLCWCCHDSQTVDQGAISSLAFNADSTRILVGFERGYIFMVDCNNGDVLRRLEDAHAPQSAVLHLRFTANNSLGLCGDSAGCIFSLSFNRRLGKRTWNSKCLFSGARGEVCVFEPFVEVFNSFPLGQHVVVAIATLSKVIVITVKPRLRVLFIQLLPRSPKCLPLLAWRMVPVGRTLQPVLAWGRGNELNYTRVAVSPSDSNKINLFPLRSVQVPYTLCALHWIGTRHLAILDTIENLHLIEVRTQREIEALELANAELVYGSAPFKALALGGGVSEAFALAGERACYNSISSRGDQLLILGTKEVHLIKLRSWPERLAFLSDQGRWTEALNLAAEEGKHNKGNNIGKLLEKYMSSLSQNGVERDNLTAAVNCCVKLNKIELLCNDLWEAVSNEPYMLDWYYTLITDHIINGALYFLNPTVAQALVKYHEEKNSETLENILLALDLSCLDLHQVMKICRTKKLFKAWIHINTKVLEDYVSPLTEFLQDLTPDNHKLGNVMLVYVSSCLTGLGYPHGKIPENDVSKVKYDVLRCLETVHSVTPTEGEKSYPYLRVLLKYNTRECLNVVELAFREPEFTGEMGLLQRQRLIQIMFEIVRPPEFNDSQIISLACFVSRLIASHDLKPDNDILSNVLIPLTNTLEKDLSVRDHYERQQAWIDLLEANKLTDRPEELLNKALKCNCYRVAEVLYEIQKDYGKIIECYLKDCYRNDDAFNYILKHYNDSERCIRKQFIDNFASLVQLDHKRCAEIVIEHFQDILENLCELLEMNDRTLFYRFVNELVLMDVKIPSDIAKKYLEILCQNDNSSLDDFVKLKLCPTEVALELTKKYQRHSATALLLEQCGNYKEALDLMLQQGMANAAVQLCIHSTEHLSVSEAQDIWLTLLKHPTSLKCMSVRQLLHFAAPHVPPTQLLELVSDVCFGDVRGILGEMLADSRHDLQMLETTFKLLSRDLHYGLAKLLTISRKPISVSSDLCRLCQKNLVSEKSSECIAWQCGHCFHTNCISGLEETFSCPSCRTTGKMLKEVKKTSPKVFDFSYDCVQVRPDLEGRF